MELNRSLYLVNIIRVCPSKDSRHWSRGRIPDVSSPPPPKRLCLGVRVQGFRTLHGHVSFFAQYSHDQTTNKHP